MKHGSTVRDFVALVAEASGIAQEELERHFETVSWLESEDGPRLALGDALSSVSYNVYGMLWRVYPSISRDRQRWSVGIALWNWKHAALWDRVLARLSSMANGSSAYEDAETKEMVSKGPDAADERKLLSTLSRIFREERTGSL